MKTKLTLIISITLIIVAACHTSKKTTTSSTANTPVVTTTTTTASAPTPTVSEEETIKSLLYLQKNLSTGVNPPTDAEVNAMKAQYQDVTLAQLQEGYAMYTHGKCLNCHASKNIYLIDDGRCKGIIDNMSQAAQLTASQKDAVYKYVLAMRATKPK